MDIVIIANFCGSFDENWRSFRFLYLAELLSKNHYVEIITSDFDHAKKSFLSEFRNDFPFKVTYLHERGYSKNISIKRFLSHFVWGLNVKHYLKNRKKSDVIYASVPTLGAAYFAGKICKRNKTKFIIDIQDLWPEAFKMFFDFTVISDVAFVPFTILENKIFKMADSICTVSNTYLNRVKSVVKQCNNTAVVYIGTELSKFDLFSRKLPMIKKDRNEIWIGYCGSLSNSYDIPTLIRAIKLIKDRGICNVKLLLIGDGQLRKQFEKLSENAKINCIYTGFIPYDAMCSLLKQCDMLVNPIRKKSAASIINKHGDYAAAGLPVINTQDSIEYRHLIEQYEMGINCANQDENEVADAIEYLITHEKERYQMGYNSRQCAQELFDREYTYTKLVSIITSWENK